LYSSSKRALVVVGRKENALFASVFCARFREK